MKKNIKIIIVLLMFNITFSQIVRPFNTMHTDNPHSSNDLSLRYYKDTNNLFNTFVGDWKYVNGNQTFIFTIWKETKMPLEKDGEIIEYIDALHGHYKMVQDYGLPTQQIVYNSNKQIFSTGTQMWLTILYANVTEPNVLTGSINDNTVPFNQSYIEGVKGTILMTIDPNSTPSTATLKIRLQPGMRGNDQPSVFNIPTDVTLTRM